MLSNFYDIMVAIIGVPTNDTEHTLIYFVSVLLGVSIILFVYKLFSIASGLLKTR